MKITMLLIVACLLTMLFAPASASDQPDPTPTIVWVALPALSPTPVIPPDALGYCHLSGNSVGALTLPSLGGFNANVILCQVALYNGSSFRVFNQDTQGDFIINGFWTNGFYINGSQVIDKVFLYVRNRTGYSFLPLIRN